MTLPLQVTFRNFEPSEELRSRIQEEAATLENYYNRIMSCRVVVELPERHHKAGSLYHVRIDLGVPGGELVIKREPSLRGAAQDIQREKAVKELEVHVPHKNVLLAVRDAFHAARRRLQDYSRRQRGDVKAHEPGLLGHVTKLFPEQDYGFLETPDQREVYFHRNAVLDGGFNRLKPGTAVRFAEEIGERGPQASTVRRMRKRSTA